MSQRRGVAVEGGGDCVYKIVDFAGDGGVVNSDGGGSSDER